MQKVCVGLALVFVLTLVKVNATRGENVDSKMAEVAFQTTEHPENPDEAEHPEETEHPKKKKAPVTIEGVALYLEGYVVEKAAEGDGWMKVPDDKTGKDLSLRLDKIHRDRLSKTDDGTYFVCADFKERGGKMYDLDFWVKDTDEGLSVTETTVHKEEGVQRYTWIEKDGVWSRKYPSTE